MNSSSQHCGDRAWYAYGTAQLFQKRARRLDAWQKVVTYLGIAGPLLVGSAALADQVFPHALKPIVAFVVAVLAGQLLVSAWAIVAHWDDRISYATRAVQAHSRLYDEYDRLARAPVDPDEGVLQRLDTEYNLQERDDLAQNVSEAEMRYAYRSACKYRRSPCYVCSQVPNSMKPTTCDGCGNF